MIEDDQPQELTPIHRPEKFCVKKVNCPDDVWSWMMVELELEHHSFDEIWLMPESEIGKAYRERMRNY